MSLLSWETPEKVVNPRDYHGAMSLYSSNMRDADKAKWKAKWGNKEHTSVEVRRIHGQTKFWKGVNIVLYVSKDTFTLSVNGSLTLTDAELKTLTEVIAEARDAIGKESKANR